MMKALTIVEAYSGHVVFKIFLMQGFVEPSEHLSFSFLVSR